MFEVDSVQYFVTVEVGEGGVRDDRFARIVRIKRDRPPVGIDGQPALYLVGSELQDQVST